MDCKDDNAIPIRSPSRGQDMDVSAAEDVFVANVPTQNRFDQSSGRGEWNIVRGSKRKKVSSSVSTNDSFSTLSTDEKLNCMFERLNGNFSMLTDIKSDQEKNHQATRHLQLSVSSLHDRTVAIEQSVSNQSKLLKMLAYKSVDAEARSRRNNLVIWGVTERLMTSCDDIVLSFLTDEMGIDTNDIVIDRSHRIGSRPRKLNGTESDPRRPIIVRFRDYWATEKVLRRAYKLKGTGFGIDRDYPKEIADARRQLYSSAEAHSARKERKNIQIRFPAKLVIDGKMVADKFPEWTEILKGNRLCKRHFEVPDPVERQDAHMLEEGNGDDLAIYGEDTEIDSDSSTVSGEGGNSRHSYAVAGGSSVDVNKHAHLSSGVYTTGGPRDSSQSTRDGTKQARRMSNSPVRSRKRNGSNARKSPVSSSHQGRKSVQISQTGQHCRNTRSRTKSRSHTRTQRSAINRQGISHEEHRSAEGTRSRSVSDTDGVCDTHL